MNILKLYKRGNKNLRGAINILLHREIKKGDKIGFRIGEKHYTITRDK